MAPKISVIVPVYNTAKYLPECLDSVLSQTLKDIEVVTINDGSPDNAIEILKEYAAKDERVKVIDKKNEGVGKARNDGIKAAGGEFVAFMDSDDFYPNTEALEKLYTAAKENGVKIAGGRKIYLSANGNTEKDDLSYKGIPLNVSGLTAYSDFQYDYGYTAYIFDRKMIVDNGILFPPYSRFQDPPFFVKAMICAEKFYAIEDETYCYRMLPSSSKYSAKKAVDMIKGITDNLRVSKEHGLSRLHYFSACRINEDVSFAASRNIADENIKTVLGAIIKACAEIDGEWLKNEGYGISVPFVPEVFNYMRDATVKYEGLRNNKLLKFVSKLKKH